MPIDLTTLDQSRQRWVPLAGVLRGVELLVKHASPREQERFRQRCVREGIFSGKANTGMNITNGREDDFFQRIAENYILDWRGDIKPEGTAYDAQKMGRVLASSLDAFNQVMEAIGEDTDFFSQRNGGS